MPITQRHTLYGVQIDATLIGGITQQNIVTGTTVDGESTSGDPYVRHQAVTEQKPQASFTTKAIAAALAQITQVGKSIDDLGTGMALYAQKRKKGGTREGASNHTKYQINDGLIIPRRLTVQGREDATLSCDVLIVYDGTNDPIVITRSVSLPAGLLDNERFALGPVLIANVVLDHLRGWDLEFGINAEVEGEGSEVWDTYVSIDDIKPELTLRGIDPDWLSDTKIPLAGKAAIHADTKIYLRKRQEGGTFVADNVAEHVKFTMAGLPYIETAVDGSGNEATETVLRLPMRYEDPNMPLLVNTATTIV